MNTRIVTIDLDTRSYDIYIGEGLLYRLNDFMPQEVTGRRVYIITDQNVESYARSIQSVMQEAGARLTEICVLPPGEQTKSFTQLEALCSWLLQNGLNRDSVIFAVGGGVIGDLAGFAAAVVMRGVSFVQIPTTLLAQVDSSVGGKTGINTAEGKNLVGAFYQPKAVIADLETLKTLPRRELLAGYAEVVKYAAINDIGFFNWLEENGDAVCNLDMDALAHTIEVSTKAKAAIVEADERESGRRALLNLGHTFGHALETIAAYDGRLLHGEAVAIGMCMAYDLSVRLGYCPREDFDRLEAHLMNVGLPTRISFIEPPLSRDLESYIRIMQRDKKAKDGKMTFILANAIGDTFVTQDVPEEQVRAVLKDALADTTERSDKGRWTSAFSSLS